MKTLPLHDTHARPGAALTEDAGWQVPASFGNPDTEYRAALGAAAVFDLSHHTKVELAGPEAREFLHNLCTNDVYNLPVGGGCEAFLTTNKARIVAHVWVGHYEQPDGGVLRLDAVAGQAGRVLDHLNHFLISEQVELTDRTDALALFRVAGPNAAAVLRTGLAVDGADLAPFENRRVDGCHVRRQSLLGVDGFDVFCPASDANEVWQRLQRAGATPAGVNAYETLRVEAGLPKYGPDIDENRFVVEVGRAQAISYTKGCYLGQEPIVMARDRGQVNRMLVGVVADGNVPLPHDARLVRDGNEVGQVKSSVWSPRLGKAIALAYVRRGHQEPGTELSLDASPPERRVIVAALPFV
jgi:folate-binding protein YgfZ